MQNLKRWLYLSLSLSLLILTGMRAWGAPFLTMLASNARDEGPQNEQPNKEQPDRDSAKPMIFTGTVVRAGYRFPRRNGSRSVYSLDDPSRVQPFEGKQVKVTGHLDAEETKLIHVDDIEAMQS